MTAKNDKLFNYAGTAIHGSSGELKVRFATDLVARSKANRKRGDDSVEYYELSEPMTKKSACEYLLKNVELTDEQRYAVTARLADLKKIERRGARQRGEVKVIGTAEELLRAIGSRERIKV